VALLFAGVYEDVRWIRRPGEGWQAAATELMQQTSQPRACALIAPTGSLALYTFFEPDLRGRLCDPNDLATRDRVVLAIGLDDPSTDAHQRLDRAYFQIVAFLRTADPRIELYRK